MQTVKSIYVSMEIVTISILFGINHSWIVAQSARLVRNVNSGSEPGGAIGAGHQNDDGNIYFAGIARSQWGTIPGKARGNTCWYAYSGQEHHTQDFDWVVAGD